MPVERMKPMLSRFFKAFFKRFLLLFLPCLIAAFAAVFFVYTRHLPASMVILASFMYVPLFFIGSFVQRARNLLPLLFFQLYLVLSLLQWDFEHYLVVFYFLPLLAYVLRKRRLLPHHLVFALALVMVVLRLIFDVEFPLGFRIPFVVIIYVTFLPPVVIKRFRERFGKLKHWLKEKTGRIQS